MNLADLSIKRPVVAVMMIMALVVFGLVSYPRIGVDLWPNVEFPVITVLVVYPGADPETMESKVADPIEEEINTLGGIRELRSVNLEGVTQVVAQFELEVPADRVLQDIRDRVARIERDLPEGIEPPVVQKFDVGAAPIMTLAVSGELPIRELTDMADDEVKARLERIQGVGGVDIVGGREREIQVLVDPNKLAGLGLSVADVAGAIKAQNMEVPAGKFANGAEELTVKTRGEVKDAEEIAAILIPTPTGAPLRVRDVARVVDGVEDATSWSALDGKSAVSLVVRKQSGSNTVAVAEAVTAAAAELAPRLAARGATLSIPKDSSVFIARSIHDVQFDLLFGGLLAVLIIYLMLIDFRATLISAVAIPTSVVATFAFVHTMGFTFNNMTTLALSLSIGILIDDAIVVIENVYRHLEQGKSPFAAASDGTREIFLAVLAMTSSILAVFVPVATMRGMIGRFFYEFGLTVSFAVATSMLVSFTLTPMLSSQFLTSAHGHGRGWLARLVNGFMGWLERVYGAVIAWSLRQRLATIGLALLALVGAFFLISRVPTEFIPPEDRSEFSVNVELPTGTSLDATQAVVATVADDLRQNAPGIKNVLARVGGGDQGQVNIGQIEIQLVSPGQRTFPQMELMSWVRKRFAPVEAGKVTVGEIPMFGGGAMRTQPVQFNIRGDNLEELDAAAKAVIAELRKRGTYVDLDTTYRGGKPELSVSIDRDRAAALGVSVASVAMTLRALVAGDAVSELKDGADVFDITLRMDDAHRREVASLANLKVRSQTGTLIDLANVVRTERTYGPSQIERQERQKQVTVLADLEGIALGPAMEEVSAVAKEVVPAHLVSDWGGRAKFMGESFGYMFSALILAIVLVYMILAAQFNSFIQPVTIMLSLPLSVIGAFGGLYFTGNTLNIMSMIGVIMLMGLVTKNAILLVDFANQRREQGMERNAALIESGKLRLRPILMTTAAMVFGMLPVALALSEGGEQRAPMAIAVIGGLITSTLLTLIVVPVVYTLLDGLVHSRALQWSSRLIFGARPATAAGHDGSHSA